MQNLKDSGGGAIARRAHAWEYRATTETTSVQALENELNRLGSDSWELVSCEYHIHLALWVLVCKRPAVTS